MPESTEESAAPSSDRQRLRSWGTMPCRVAATVVLSLLTSWLWLDILIERWHWARAISFLALAAGLLNLLVLAVSVSWRRDGPVLLDRIASWRPWLLVAWGLVLAAAGGEFLRQDQLRIRGSAGFSNVMADIEASDELARRLGRPIRPGWLVSGRWGYDEGKDGSYDGGWSYDFSVAGPQGSGHIQARRVDARRSRTDRDGQWSDSILVIVDGTGERLELVKPRAECPDTGVGR